METRTKAMLAINDSITGDRNALGTLWNDSAARYHHRIELKAAAIGASPILTVCDWSGQPLYDGGTCL
jgi:hypothetical protein